MKIISSAPRDTSVNNTHGSLMHHVCHLISIIYCRWCLFTGNISLLSRLILQRVHICTLWVRQWTNPLIQIIFTTHATEFILPLLRRFTNMHLFITIIFLFTSFLRKIMLLNVFLMFCRTSNCSKIRFLKKLIFLHSVKHQNQISEPSLFNIWCSPFVSPICMSVWLTATSYIISF